MTLPSQSDRYDSPRHPERKPLGGERNRIPGWKKVVGVAGTAAVLGTAWFSASDKGSQELPFEERPAIDPSGMVETDATEQTLLRYPLQPGETLTDIAKRMTPEGGDVQKNLEDMLELNEDINFTSVQPPSRDAVIVLSPDISEYFLENFEEAREDERYTGVYVPMPSQNPEELPK